MALAACISRVSIFEEFMWFRKLFYCTNPPSLSSLPHTVMSDNKNSNLFWAPNHSYEISHSFLVRLTNSCIATVTIGVYLNGSAPFCEIIEH